MVAQISFPSIPANLKIPLFQLEFAGGAAGGQVQQNSLLIGPTITAQPEIPVFVPSVARAVALFGSNSILAAMVEAYLAADPFGSLWCLPVADAAGAVKATGKITITGPATAAGVLALYIDGRSIPVPVAAAEAADALATAVAAAVNAYVDANGVGLPVTAAVDGVNNFQVNLTAANGGTPGNGIDVRLNYYGAQGGEATAAGLTIAITAMAAGATDPDTSGFEAILGSENYDFIAIPWNQAAVLNNFKTLMTDRWSWQQQIYGHVFAAKKDADSTGAGNIAFGATRNDQHVSCMAFEPAPPSEWTVAAAFAGAAASSLRADPARPLQTLSLPGLLAPPATARYTMATQQTLLSGGMALMSYAKDGSCTILRAVTTYQKNQWGSPDYSYLDTETLYTLMAVVRQLKADVTQAYPRAKLADDGTNFGPGTMFSAGAPDQPITTPNGIRATIIASYARMADNGWVEDPTDFAKGLVVQRNANDASRVDVLYDPILVSGLRILAVLTQFYLQAPSVGSTSQP